MHRGRVKPGMTLVRAPVVLSCARARLFTEWEMSASENLRYRYPVHAAKISCGCDPFGVDLSITERTTCCDPFGVREASDEAQWQHGI